MGHYLQNVCYREYFLQIYWWKILNFLIWIPHEFSYFYEVFLLNESGSIASSLTLNYKLCWCILSTPISLWNCVLRHTGIHPIVISVRYFPCKCIFHSHIWRKLLVPFPIVKIPGPPYFLRVCYRLTSKTNNLLITLCHGAVLWFDSYLGCIC